MAKKVSVVEPVKIKKYMYIGPPLRKGLIHTNQVVEENFRTVFADEIKKVPNLEKLFIDIDEIATKMVEIDRPDSIYKVWIKEVTNAI